MSKKFIPLYISAKIIKIDRDFPKLWSQMYCHLFYGSQCIDSVQQQRIENGLQLSDDVYLRQKQNNSTSTK